MSPANSQQRAWPRQMRSRTRATLPLKVHGGPWGAGLGWGSTDQKQTGARPITSKAAAP